MRLLVLYGSQTGTAQDVAEQIWRESKKFGFTGPVLPMDEYPVDQLISERLIVFVVATTGDGEEPDNMKKTWKFLLRRSLPKDSLNQLQFACLGLGDSSYEKFNYASKKLNKRLQSLGASTICPIGLCDDQHDHGFGAVALDWINNLWSTLNEISPLTKLNDDKVKPISKFRLEVLQNSMKTASLNRLCWPLRDEYCEFELIENKRTTSGDHFQDVRFLRFQYPVGTTWKPGDVLQLRPHNSEEQVATFFQLVEEHKLDFNSETVVQISSVYDDMPLPVAYEEPVSIGLVAKYVWDLSAKPRQRFFELLSQNCTDELEGEKLLEFTTAEGLEELISYVNRPRRSILEVLQDFRHSTSKLTLPLLFELMPIIQPRSFSIASSAGADHTLDLLVAVVNYKTKLSTPRLGLCSNWLKNLSVGDKVLGSIKKGTMSLPTEINRPLIMIGPGTGIAPFRSIIQYRLEAKGEIGPLVVFFGCRSETKDFHFVEDFKAWKDANFVQSFFAFSRDQDHKIYVQDRIKEKKEFLSGLLRTQNAYIYVAGSSNSMPKAVKEAFIEILDNDKEFVEKLIKAKRYQEETWS